MNITCQHQSKESGIAELILDKLDFREKFNSRNKEGSFMIKEVSFLKWNRNSQILCS